MMIRDRIKELRRVSASALRPHPKKWRTHPTAQRDALQGVLAEIGYAAALLARELPDGSLQLIDGHLRAETTPEMEVPVLIVDLDDAETAKLLVLLDPLAASAGTNPEMLADLMLEVQTESAAVRAMLDRLGGVPEEAELDADATETETSVPELYQVVVECRDEEQQQEVYERLVAEGLKCRLMTL